MPYKDTKRILKQYDHFKTVLSLDSLSISDAPCSGLSLFWINRESLSQTKLQAIDTG